MSTTVRIVKTPDVLHGKPRIEGTRIGVFQLGELVREKGWTTGEVTEQFDVADEQLEAALEYYDAHPELMETLRAQHEAGVRSASDQSRAE